MHEPFLAPDRLQGPRGHLGHQAQDVRAAPCAEGVLLGGGGVRVAWIEGRPQAQQDQAGVQVGLVEGIDVDVLPQVTAVPDVASLGVEPVLAGRLLRSGCRARCSKAVR